MKKRFLSVFMSLFIIFSSFSICFSDDTKEYEQTKDSIDNYIDDQLNKIDIGELESYIKEDSALKQVDLKEFIKGLISGEKSVLDLFDKDHISDLLFNELKSSLKIISIVLVLALLSSVLKSLDNSFSSGSVSTVTTYIIFITMVSLTLIGFKDVLEICYESIDNTIGLMNVVMPILIGLLVVIGFPITSIALNPIFMGVVTIINIVFKNFLLVTVSISFAILVISNLSKNIKLKKMSTFVKQINLVTIMAIFTGYLGIVAIQGFCVTSFDGFAVKTAKFAVGNFIPVVGGFVSDSVDILLSASELIKDIFGVVGLVVLVGIAIIPIVKVISIIFVYKISAIIIEPIGEEGISSFLNEVANLMMILLACVIAISIMFFVTIAVVTSISTAAHI